MAAAFRALAADALVVAVGADSPGERECDTAVLERATAVVADDRQQSRQVGELQHATSPLEIRELGDIVARPGTAPPSGIRLCDLTGLGAHDAAVAAIVIGAG
ncbi:hypothetical protein [Pseudonocardia sp. GCM10023141]|uniref:hypothetical protein n=1 Tax=Pseudonocardia sp. GCM10023141 TaxID=3252653 RepID=UPI00360C275D